MFRKTIQNIETSRNGPSNNYQPEISSVNNGYNTERYDRYSIQQQNKHPSNNPQLLNHRKTISSGQFSQLSSNQIPNNQNKIIKQNRPSQLIIRQCDVSQLNTFKKNTPRQIEQINNLYQFGGSNAITHNNSSNKKQRMGIGSRKTYDSSYKQPLQQIHYSDRDNVPTKTPSDRSSFHNDSSYQIHQQLQTLKQYIFQIHQQQSSQIKKTKTQIKTIQNQCMGELESFANQISKQLNKQKQDLIVVNKKTIQNQREMRYLKESFNSFVKDNEQKIQSLVLDIHGNGNNVKKSRNNDQFGVDLKSSSNCINAGGMGTSMSINFQNDNVNLKLYNQLSAQIELLKGELEQSKQRIDLLQRDTKNIQLQRKNSKSQLKQPNKQKVDFRQVQKLITDMFSQQRKKFSNNEKIIQQEIKNIDAKITELFKVYSDVDMNIKGMNAEFTRVINGTVIKKQKQLQTKLTTVEQKINELNQKLNPTQFTETLKSQVKRILEQKSSKTRILKIRQPTHNQKLKLDQTADSSFTYMLDQEGCLLDSAGAYIMQSSQKGRSKIKIEKEMLYLLETQGMHIQGNQGAC